MSQPKFKKGQQVIFIHNDGLNEGLDAPTKLRILCVNPTGKGDDILSDVTHDDSADAGVEPPVAMCRMARTHWPKEAIYAVQIEDAEGNEDDAAGRTIVPESSLKAAPAARS